MQRRFALPADLNNALCVTFVMLLGAELLGLIGSGFRLHEKVLIQFDLDTALPGGVPQQWVQLHQLDGQQSLNRNVAFLRRHSPESSAREGAAR